MLYPRAPSDVTETSRRGHLLSCCAAVSVTALFLCETRAYFATTLGTGLSLNRNDDERRIRLNFDVTMLDLPCEHVTVDVLSTLGGPQQNVTRHVVKHPVDADGVRVRGPAAAPAGHQDDVELWDPAVPDALEDLHADGEDAIGLDDASFPYAVGQFPFLFVQFHHGESCAPCDDLAPTWEALGEVVTDAAMDLVDRRMEETRRDYSDDEYESAVNTLAPALVTKLDCSAYPDVCQAQGVRAYPTMRIFVDGTAQADYKGHRTVLELVHFLTDIEAEHREPGELKMHKVHEYATERTVRSEEDQAWNEALTRYRAPHQSYNITDHHGGCRVSGHVLVDAAPGTFRVHARSRGHAVAAHATNASHVVHHFSFGDLAADVDARRALERRGLPGMSARFVRSLHPMDDRVYATAARHQAHHHHLRVVATEFGDTGARGTPWARHTARRVFRILENSQLSTYRRHIVPAAQWSYEVDALRVSYREESRTWYDYFTGVLAIVGGAFTVVGMLESGLSSCAKKSSCY